MKKKTKQGVQRAAVVGIGVRVMLRSNPFRRPLPILRKPAPLRPGRLNGAFVAGFGGGLLGRDSIAWERSTLSPPARRANPPRPGAPPRVASPLVCAFLSLRFVGPAKRAFLGPRRQRAHFGRTDGAGLKSHGGSHRLVRLLAATHARTRSEKTVATQSKGSRYACGLTELLHLLCSHRVLESH